MHYQETCLSCFCTNNLTLFSGVLPVQGAMYGLENKGRRYSKSTWRTAGKRFSRSFVMCLNLIQTDGKIYCIDICLLLVTLLTYVVNRRQAEIGELLQRQLFFSFLLSVNQRTQMLKLLSPTSLHCLKHVLWDIAILDFSRH